MLPRLRRFAHGLARDRADADDLTQAAAERILKSRAQWRPGTSFDAWAYRILRNLWIDTTRSRRRHDAVLAPEEQGLSVGAAGEAEANVELGYLMRAMARLPEEQREVVVMRIYGEMSFKEISDITGVSINTALGRMRYALINMRRMINDYKMVLR